MDKGYDIGVYILISIIICFVLLSINWLFTFRHFWALPEISIRRPKSVLFVNVLTILGMIRLAIQLYISMNPAFFHRMYLIQSFLAHATTLAALSCIVHRTWLVYYDIKFNQALEAEQWQSQIDTQTLKHSWYIRNRKTFRNPTKVAIGLFLPWCWFAVAGTLSVVIKGRNPISLLCFALNMVLPPIFLMILICKMPQYDDNFKLRKESWMESIIGCMCFLLLIVTITAGSGPGDLVWIAVQLTHTLILFFISYASLFWVFCQFKLPTFYCSLGAYRQSLSLIQDTQSKSEFSSGASSVNIDTGNVDKNTANKFKELEFTDVFKDAELFNIFASHLSKEFAVESVLFFVEIHQFAEYLKDKHEVEVNADNFELSAETIPKSTIVMDLNKGGTLNDAVINLFRKYVDYDDAYFCINVSHETREALYGIVGYEFWKQRGNMSKQEAMNSFMSENNINAKQIYDAFEQSSSEICNLLLSSFLRFKKIKSKFVAIQKN